jgi:hypothetical protein
MIEGTQSEKVIGFLNKIEDETRGLVKEVTMKSV